MTIGTNKKNTTIENILKDLQEPEKLNIKMFNTTKFLHASNVYSIKLYYYDK